MKLSRHAITLAAAACLAIFASQASGQVRVAVVDLRRALTETEDGRRAGAQLKRLAKRRQDELDGAQRAVETLQKQMEKQGSVWNDETKQAKAMELQKLVTELRSDYTDFQKQLANEEARLTQPIMARMRQIMERMGQSEGYTLIVERTEAGVVWSPSNLDLTDVVIQRYNAGDGRDGEAPTKRARPRRPAAAE